MNIFNFIKKAGILVFFCSVGIVVFGQSTILINPSGGASAALNDGLKIQITTDARVHVYRENQAQYYNGPIFPNTSVAVQTRFCFERNGVYNTTLMPFTVCNTTPAVQDPQNANIWTASMSGYVTSPISATIFYITMNFSYTHPNKYFAVDYIVRAPASLPGGAEIVHIYLDHDTYILGYDDSRGYRNVDPSGEIVGNFRNASDNTSTTCVTTRYNNPHFPSHHGFKADGIGFRSYYTGMFSSRMNMNPDITLTNVLNTTCMDDGVAVEFVTPALSAGQTAVRRILHCYGDVAGEFDTIAVGTPAAPGASSPVTVNFTSSTYDEWEGSTTHPASTIQVVVSGGTLSQAQTITMSATNITAVQNTDYTYQAGFIIPAGNYSSPQTLTLNNINIIGNTIACQSNRSFRINLLVNNCNDLAIPGATINQATVTILEDDSLTVNQPLNIGPHCLGVSVPTTVFTGSSVPGTTYDWSATNGTAIGLPSNSGTGNLPAFTTTNTGNTVLTSTVTVTPKYGTTCSGHAKTFIITVDPIVTPVITINAIAN